MASRRIVIFLVALIISLGVRLPILAVDPQSGTVTVTATVPGEPDMPTLISPTNNSTLSTNTPSFVFSPSLGEILVDHYDLYIDGAKNTSPIAQSLQTIVTQALTALSEGTHTWYVQAVAESGRTRNSATWTFTIDTTAPFVLVTSVADQATSLSSLDLTPWQNTTISFTTNQRYPAIAGQSEAGATIEIDFEGETVTGIVDSNRLFSLKPKTALRLGRHQVIVKSTDQAGNTTTLPAFYLDITSAAAPITISLPSPLPDLSFTIPISIPETLFPVTAFPLIPAVPEALNYLVWLTIVTYLCHIYCLNRLIHRLYLHHSIKSYHFVFLYITIILPAAILAYIFVYSRHWLPLTLSLLTVFTLVYETKLMRSKDIKIEQM